MRSRPRRIVPVRNPPKTATVVTKPGSGTAVTVSGGVETGGGPGWFTHSPTPPPDSPVAPPPAPGAAEAPPLGNSGGVQESVPGAGDRAGVEYVGLPGIGLWAYASIWLPVSPPPGDGVRAVRTTWGDRGLVPEGGALAGGAAALLPPSPLLPNIRTAAAPPAPARASRAVCSEREERSSEASVNRTVVPEDVTINEEDEGSGPAASAAPGSARAATPARTALVAARVAVFMTVLSRVTCGKQRRGGT
jgi:hypothetical protein